MYAKVFAQIFDSSIANDYQLRHFFTDLLVLAEIDGVVDMTQEAISARTRIPLELVNKFLAELQKPDPRSRSHLHEGKRIVPIDPDRDWGWQIVNFSEYRRIASDEQRREKTKLRTRKWRNPNNEPTCDAPVTHGDASGAMQKQKQRQKETKGTHTPSVPKPLAHSEPLQGECVYAEQPDPKPDTVAAFNRFWTAYPRKVGRIEAERAFVEVNAVSVLPAIMEAIGDQSQSQQWRSDGGRYIPLAHKWLINRRWEDVNGQRASEDQRILRELGI